MVKIKGNIAEFSLYRPGASKVSLCGEFNHWRPNDIKMARDEKGYWRIKLHLPAGEFRFRYFVDGVWYADYAAFGVLPGRFGLDSIVNITPRTISIGQPVETKQAEEFAAA